jgi:hypothetical protein
MRAGYSIDLFNILMQEYLKFMGQQIPILLVKASGKASGYKKNVKRCE